MNHSEIEPQKHLAAVCGLFCAGCSLYIATTEEPERLKRIAVEFGITPDDAKCYGCRSEKRLPYCQTCKMQACADEKGVDFCGQCDEFPCLELKQFQAGAAHRLDLWNNFKRINEAGWEKWFQEMNADYACPVCGTLNSAYDSVCRKCGEMPGCPYVERHRATMLKFPPRR